MKIFEKIKEKVTNFKNKNYIVDQKHKKLVNLINEMAEDYYCDHQKYSEKNEKLNELLNELLTNKEKSNKSINKLEQMNKKRQLDYIISRLLDDAKKIVTCKKYGNTENIKKIEENYNKSYNDFRKFLNLNELKSNEKEKSYNPNPEFIKKIKNPIYSDDTLKSIISVYANYNREENSFYSALMGYGEENTESNYDAYKVFRNNIYKKEIAKIMSKSDEEIKKNTKNRIKQNVLLNLYKLAKPYILLVYGKHTWRRLQNSSVNNYYFPEKEIKQLVSKYGIDEIFELYDELHKKQDDVSKGKYKYTKDESKIIKLIDEWMISKHNFYGLLGFFAHNEQGEFIDEKAKLYINAETKDIYILAEMFMDLANKADLKCHFKVIDGEYDFPKRSEKLVIYAELKDLEKYVVMLQQIKRENPEIKVKKPPLIAGCIDNWIGVGADPRSHRVSYNALRAKILQKAIEETFSDVPKEELISFVKKHPEKISEFRAKILDVCQENNVPKDYFFFEQECVDFFKGKEVASEVKEVFDKNENKQCLKSYDKNKATAIFDSKEQQEEMDRVLNLINQGKDFNSAEMKELFKQIAEERATRIKQQNADTILNERAKKTGKNRNSSIGIAREF